MATCAVASARRTSADPRPPVPLRPSSRSAPFKSARDSRTTGTAPIRSPTTSVSAEQHRRADRVEANGKPERQFVEVQHRHRPQRPRPEQHAHHATDQRQQAISVSN